MSQNLEKFVEVEHHFQQRIMVQTFCVDLENADEKTLKKQWKNQWKKQWMEELGKWHSPYTLVLVSAAKVDETSPLWAVLAEQADFFKKFFLKKVVLCGDWHAPAGSDWVVCPDLDASLAKAGWRGKKAAVSDDFRSQLQFENFFKQNVIELSFANPVKVDSSQKLQAIKSKLTNQLMQWHSPWSLLINCGNLLVEKEQSEALGAVFKSFEKLYMLKIIGYSPSSKDAAYPFKVYRSRHKAAAELDSANAIAGDTANCSSR